MYCHSLQHAVQNCNQIVVNAISTSTLMEVTNLSKKYLGFYNYASKYSQSCTSKISTKGVV